uniref:Family with sequence similarity 32 member A n=1 Tax=Pygocentrus nattereri TaxID=42514 RepID=A0AAR2IXM5_PYGNA
VLDCLHLLPLVYIPLFSLRYSLSIVCGSFPTLQSVAVCELHLASDTDLPRFKPWTVSSPWKKKKDKERKHLDEQVLTAQNGEEETKKVYVDKRTPAQLAFDKIQEKRQMERILNKASKTHKQRVEDFNRHLDTLTEHYDIPKVSWTK